MFTLVVSVHENKMIHSIQIDIVQVSHDRFTAILIRNQDPFHNTARDEKKFKVVQSSAIIKVRAEMELNGKD